VQLPWQPATVAEPAQNQQHPAETLRGLAKQKFGENPKSPKILTCTTIYCGEICEVTPSKLSTTAFGKIFLTLKSPLIILKPSGL